MSEKATKCRVWLYEGNYRVIISNSVLQQNPEKIKVDYHVRHTALCKSLGSSPTNLLFSNQFYFKVYCLCVQLCLCYTL